MMLLDAFKTCILSKIATNMEKLGNLDTARLVSSASALQSHEIEDALQKHIKLI